MHMVDIILRFKLKILQLQQEYDENMTDIHHENNVGSEDPIVTETSLFKLICSRLRKLPFRRHQHLNTKYINIVEVSS